MALRVHLVQWVMKESVDLAVMLGLLDQQGLPGKL